MHHENIHPQCLYILVDGNIPWVRYTRRLEAHLLRGRYLAYEIDSWTLSESMMKTIEVLALKGPITEYSLGEASGEIYGPKGKIPQSVVSRNIKGTPRSDYVLVREEKGRKKADRKARDPGLLKLRMVSPHSTPKKWRTGLLTVQYVLTFPELVRYFSYLREEERHGNRTSKDVEDKLNETIKKYREIYHHPLFDEFEYLRDTLKKFYENILEGANQLYPNPRTLGRMLVFEDDRQKEAFWAEKEEEDNIPLGPYDSEEQELEKRLKELEKNYSKEMYEFTEHFMRRYVTYGYPEYIEIYEKWPIPDALRKHILDMIERKQILLQLQTLAIKTNDQFWRDAKDDIENLPKKESIARNAA